MFTSTKFSKGSIQYLGLSHLGLIKLEFECFSVSFWKCLSEISRMDHSKDSSPFGSLHHTVHHPARKLLRGRDKNRCQRASWGSYKGTQGKNSPRFPSSSCSFSPLPTLLPVIEILWNIIMLSADLGIFIRCQNNIWPKSQDSHFLKEYDVI